MSDKKTMELRKKKFSEYGFEKYNIDPKPLPENLPDEVNLSSDNPDFKDCFADIKIESVEQLKMLVGVPSAMANKKMSHEIDENCDIHEFAKLVMLGDWENDLSQNPRAAEVEKYIFSRVNSIPVGAFKDLVVKDGQKVNMTEPTYYFDNVTVYGSGEIVLNGQVKMIVSGEVQYIDKA